MRTYLLSHNKTLSFCIKGALDPQALNHKWPDHPAEQYLKHHDTIELDLSHCSRLEASSIHWIATLYKRCCHLEKTFWIKKPKKEVKKQLLAMELDFLIKPKTRH